MEAQSILLWKVKKDLIKKIIKKKMVELILEIMVEKGKQRIMSKNRDGSLESGK